MEFPGCAAQKTRQKFEGWTCTAGIFFIFFLCETHRFTLWAETNGAFHVWASKENFLGLEDHWALMVRRSEGGPLTWLCENVPTVTK